MTAGLVAAFASEDDLLIAIQRMRSAGYARLDAFTPHPVEGLDEVLGLERSRLGWLVFPVGAAGAAGAFLLMAWCNAWDYPLDVGHRPPLAVPAFVPIAFEMGVLGAALAGFVLLLWVLGLPRLSHPIFSAEGFERVTDDLFWLGIEAGDPALDRERTPRELLALGARVVTFFGRAPLTGPPAPPTFVGAP